MNPSNILSYRTGYVETDNDPILKKSVHEEKTAYFSTQQNRTFAFDQHSHNRLWYLGSDRQLFDTKGGHSKL